MYRALFQIYITVLIWYTNYSVNAVTEQRYDPGIVKDGRLLLLAFFKQFDDLSIDAPKRFQLMQNEIPESTPFYCDAKNGPGKRSDVRPTSIHQVRPGDIDIIAAMGDSLTGGTGLTATHLLDIFAENRGMVFTIGGQATWRKFTTLPNILKEFNPNIYGYSFSNSHSTDRDSKFNVAEGAAESRDLLYLSKVLKQRLIHDPKVNMTNDWKLLTIFIGGIDFCFLACYEENPKIPVDRHDQDLVKALRYLRDNIPRLIVNIVPGPNPRPLVEIKRSITCEILYSLVCPCFSLKSKSWKVRAENIIFEWYKREQEVASREEFHTSEFSVIAQPFITNATIPTLKNGRLDSRYFAIDCLHFSQKMHGMSAIALWNNMLEPLGQKSVMDYRNLVFKCPTEERPFIAT